MLLMRTDSLPDDPQQWVYQLKLDGYRAVAVKTADDVQLRSRNDIAFNKHYPSVVRALAGLPSRTVIDGEIVALDDDGRPSFGKLQNATSSTDPVWYYVFDVMILRGGNVMDRGLDERRQLLEEFIVPTLAEPVRYLGDLEARLPELVHSAKTLGFEGLVAKRRDSRYEPGLRSGHWRKMRINRGQEFVIGGYTIGTQGFDALIIGCYDGDRLMYAGRTRNGFTPALRRRLIAQFRPLEIPTCPFTNLPERSASRWGRALTLAKMAECRWLNPVLVGQFEFAEWTADNHLRHSSFVGLRTDRAAHDVRRE